MKKEETEKGCLYYNSDTGKGYATINRGLWYNEALFLYLIKKYSPKKGN
jgi:hypothetical protein